MPRYNVVTFMTAECGANNNPYLEKTIKFDRGIRSAAMYIAVTSTATVCIAPLVLLPAALLSTAVYYAANHQIKINQKELGELTS